MAKCQPCWSCIKACGGCSWSDRSEPVPGWDAVVRLQPGTNGRERITSYAITKCPEYDPDPRAVEWEKSLGYLRDGGRKKRGMKDGVKVPLKATSVHTGEVRFYESFAAAVKDGFYTQKINMVLAGERAYHHGWKFERVGESS